MNAASHVIEVSVENFQAEVAEKSKQIPVLLEFYADGAEASQQLASVLLRLAGEYQGKFILARVDIQRNQQLAQQLGVRALPTIKIIFQGQMVESLEGLIEESQLRLVLDKVTMSPVERVRDQLDIFLADGDRISAIEMLQQIIEDEPNNYVMHTELCDLLIMEDRVDEAKQILAGLPPDCAGIDRPTNRLEFLDAAASLAPAAELASKLEGDGDNFQLRFDLATRFVANDQIEQALEQLLDILQKDREWREQLARTTMIRVFELLGKGDELATTYRRKMFTFLH